MMKRYTETGFWLEREGDIVTIGLSEKGQDDLGDIAFCEFLAQDELRATDVFFGVEASKAVTELVSPLNGQVIAWHGTLLQQPELLNQTNSADNWIVKITVVNDGLWETHATEPIPVNCTK